MRDSSQPPGSLVHAENGHTLASRREPPAMRAEGNSVAPDGVRSTRGTNKTARRVRRARRARHDREHSCEHQDETNAAQRQLRSHHPSTHPLRNERLRQAGLLRLSTLGAGTNNAITASNRALSIGGVTASERVASIDDQQSVPARLCGRPPLRRGSRDPGTVNRGEENPRPRARPRNRCRRATHPERELAINDFHARAERRAARRVADREKQQLTAGLEDVLSGSRGSGNPRATRPREPPRPDRRRLRA